MCGGDLCFRGDLEHAHETIVVTRAQLEGSDRVSFPASRCARASLRLGQIDEVQAETSARVFRHATYGPSLSFCPTAEVEDH